MLSDRRFLTWCLRQRSGIRIVKPSDNLARAYLKDGDVLCPFDEVVSAGAIIF